MIYFKFSFATAVVLHNVKYLHIFRIFGIITLRQTESKNVFFCSLKVTLHFVHSSNTFSLFHIIWHAPNTDLRLYWHVLVNVISHNRFHNILRNFDYGTKFPPPPKSMLRTYVYTTGGCLYFSAHAVYIPKLF